MYFATDSTVIEPRTRAQIQEIAQAAHRLDLTRDRLLIIGHTDSRGPEAYNQALSWRRARAVKPALINDYGLPADDLLVDGKGESELRVQPERSPADFAKTGASSCS